MEDYCSPGSSEELETGLCGAQRECGSRDRAGEPARKETTKGLVATDKHYSLSPKTSRKPLRYSCE